MPGLDKSFTEYRLGRNIAWLSYTCGLRFIGDRGKNKQGTDYEFGLRMILIKTIINEHKLNHRIRYQTLRYNLEDIRDSRNQWRYKWPINGKLKIGNSIQHLPENFLFKPNQCQLLSPIDFDYTSPQTIN